MHSTSSFLGTSMKVRQSPPPSNMNCSSITNRENFQWIPSSQCQCTRYFYQSLLWSATTILEMSSNAINVIDVSKAWIKHKFSSMLHFLFRSNAASSLYPSPRLWFALNSSLFNPVWPANPLMILGAIFLLIPPKETWNDFNQLNLDRADASCSVNSSSSVAGIASRGMSILSTLSCYFWISWLFHSLIIM